MVKRVAVRAAICLTVVCVCGAVFGAGVASARSQAAVARRVLILSLPYVSWRDLHSDRVPNLTRLFNQSALANLVPRTVGARGLASGYLTIGAGNRATATTTTTAGITTPSLDGAAFEATEPVGTGNAADAFAALTGRTQRDGIVQLGIGPIVAANRSLTTLTRVGALGNALARAGYTRAVIANADEKQPYLVIQPGRQAVNALMSSEGSLPAGAVGSDLLTQDGRAPFGLRLDTGRVVHAFKQVWKPQSVVLVEASDLARAADLAKLTSPRHARQAFRAALARTDRLVGRLMRDVDLHHDAVLVVGPTPSPADSFTVAALHAPGVRPGILQTASTGRAGYVLLGDVAPTILKVLGLSRSPAMKGRPFVSVAANPSEASRQAQLVDSASAAQFRDRMLKPVVNTFIVMEALLGLAAVAVISWASRARTYAALSFAAVALLGFVPATFLARLIPFQNTSTVLYAVFLAGTALVIAALATVVGRAHPLDPVLIALGMIVALFTVDLLTGAHLQLSSVFSYSPSAGIRSEGIGNVGAGFLGAASLLFAALITARIRRSTGTALAIGVLATTLVIVGAPFWGDKVGAVLSMTPAFAVTATLLLGQRVRFNLRTVLACVAVTAIGIAVKAAIDFTRPPDAQPHLARLLQQIRDHGITALTNSISHKLTANLATLTQSEWRYLVPIVLLFTAYLAYAPPRPLPTLLRRIPTLRAGLIGFATLALLGYALNDSGIAVPATMLAVLNCTLISLLPTTRCHRTTDRPSDHDPAPQEIRLFPTTTRSRSWSRSSARRETDSHNATSGPHAASQCRRG
jgi:hypothetical protein